MRNFTLTILAAFAVLLLAVGGGAAYERIDTGSDRDQMPENASATEWTTWMEQHMTEYMGTDAATRMQERMGMSYEEMGEHMASHENGSMTNGMGCH